MEWRYVEGLGWVEEESVTGPPVPTFDESAAQSAAFRESTEADWVSDDELEVMFADGRLLR